LTLIQTPKKLGYCIECILESHDKGTFPQKTRTPAKYLQETSDFYNKCRQRAHNAGEPPAEYVNELAKKAERLEMLSKHIDKEKRKVKERFEDIRKSMLDIIDLKEKECLKLLEDEVLGLSDLYTEYEKLLATGWLKASDVEGVYPTSDALEQRLSKIANMEHVQAFVKEVTEDIQIENVYSDEKDGLRKRKDRIHHLISCPQKLESLLPDLQGMLMNSSSEDLKNFMKELLKEFNQQEMRVENSIARSVKEMPSGSQIINFEQCEILKGWLHNFKNLSLKLLYRGSEDGFSGKMIHHKCDNKGATVTLIKCKFEGADSSSVLGGYLDQSWNSTNSFVTSNKAFIFSLTAGTIPIKCPILESKKESAFCGSYGSGVGFGGGHDLCIRENFTEGYVFPCSYSNANALRPQNQKNFAVEEVEVFQVQYS